MGKKDLGPDRPTLGVLLRGPLEALTQEVYARLAAQGFPDVRPAHGAVFRHIRSEGSRASDLAARAQMTKQSMAYLVESLAALGYVEQVPDPDDGRARRVLLTPRGRAAQEAASRASREVEESWAAAYGRDEWRALREHLERLHARLATSPSEALV